MFYGLSMKSMGNLWIIHVIYDISAIFVLFRCPIESLAPSHPQPPPAPAFKASDALSQFEQLLQSEPPPEVAAEAATAPSVGDVSYTAAWWRNISKLLGGFPGT